MGAARSRLGWQFAAAAVLTPPGFVALGDAVTPGPGQLPSALVVAAALVAAGGAWYGFAVRRTRRTPAWWALAAAALLLVGAALAGDFGVGRVVVLVMLLVGAGLTLYAARPALPLATGGRI